VLSLSSFILKKDTRFHEVQKTYSINLLNNLRTKGQFNQFKRAGLELYRLGIPFLFASTETSIYNGSNVHRQLVVCNLTAQKGILCRFDLELRLNDEIDDRISS
jgi:hypothetical protein